MKTLIITLLSCFAIAAVSGKAFETKLNEEITAKDGSRINGGSPATVGQFPWQVLLNMLFPPSTISLGGGCLISPTRVLTAAHNWFDGIGYATKMTVFFGTLSSGSGLEVVASNVIIHENYDSIRVLNDMAMVHLPYAVQYTANIQPAGLPFGSEVNDNFAGSDAVATGYGITPQGMYGVLNYVNVKVMENQDCARDLGVTGNFVEPSNVCTSGTGYVGTCNGDSGGPLVVYRNNQAILIGLTSFGVPECYNNSPSVYTRVTSYKSWVESHL